MTTSTVRGKAPTKLTLQEGDQSTPPASGSGPGGFIAFGELCAKLLDLYPNAVVMMTFAFILLNGTRMNHFDILFVADYGWIIGAVSFLFTMAILLFGVMSQLAQIQKGKATVFRVVCGSILLLTMTFATLYCAAANLIGIEKLQSNLSASQQTIRQ